MTRGSYISKSDRPYTNRPSPHLQLAPPSLASRSSVMSQPFHYRGPRLHRTRQVRSRTAQLRMIMKGSPGNDISDTELQQRHDLTKIISDGAVEGPYHRR